MQDQSTHIISYAVTMLRKPDTACRYARNGPERAGMPALTGRLRAQVQARMQQLLDAQQTRDRLYQQIQQGLQRASHQPPQQPAVLPPPVLPPPKSRVTYTVAPASWSGTTAGIAAVTRPETCSSLSGWKLPAAGQHTGSCSTCLSEPPQLEARPT